MMPRIILVSKRNAVGGARRGAGREQSSAEQAAERRARNRR